MPKDTIERAIAKGTGDGGGETIEALRYEAYAPGGTALIIEALTDNRNRTANDLKHILSKNGGTLALAGAVTFLFDHRGVIQLAGVETLSEEEELSLIDAGAEDILRGEGIIEIKTQPSHLATLTDVALKLFPGAKLVSSEFEWIPKSLVETDEVMAQAVMALTDALEDHDDISRIFSNLA
jgi:YebC/PmpR family DNA-binding regulatory protein